MSLFDSASLCITPNAYKEDKLYSIKPTDGSGDLVVTRATTATRVNSAGLIELVPYNLFTYSEQFDNAAWDKSSGTITANSTTAPNGTTTADTFTGNGALSNHDFFQGFTGGANTTASIYVKKNTAQFVYISLNYQSSGVNWATGVYDLDNLTTATFQSGGVTNQVATITNVGNGWRRITLSVATENTTLFCMYGLSDSMSPTLGSRGRLENSSSQSFYIWGAQLVTGTSAKEYFPTTDRLNVPRIDYTNGSCPSILVEPQRSNVLLRSQEFDNVAWLTFRSSVSSNATISPDGTTNAEKLIQQSGANDAGGIYQLLTISNATVYTYSFFAKADGFNFCFLRLSNSPSDFYAWFNLSTGAVGSTSGGTTSSSIVSYGNGWYRCSMTFTSVGITAIPHIYIANSNGSDQTPGADGVKGIFAYGAQIEAGSYATSYIPTVASSVTRNADVISKTGISSLIGQTEGTMFLDLFASGENSDSDPGFSLLLDIGNTTSVEIYTNNGTIGFIIYKPTLTIVLSSYTIVPNEKIKIALRYKSGQTAMFINGTQVASSADTFTLSGISELNINKAIGANLIAKNSINTVALFKTGLTNSELAELTTL
jgi:hypothetical protein